MTSGVGSDGREESFVGELSSLLARHDVAVERQSEILRAMARAIESTGDAPSLRIVPFKPGWRPTDELAHPGLGSSDCAAVRTGGDADANRAYVLFDVGQASEAMTVDATIHLAVAGGAPGVEPLPGWDRRPMQIGDDGASTRQQLQFHPERDIAPDACSFANGYLRRAVVTVRATIDGVPVSVDETTLDVCDVSNLGSLYERVVQRIVAPDTARQAAAARVVDPGAAYHPWFPVLTIGADKAALYTSALVADIVGKQRHLTDPAWLLRVGVYLELLTCLGIFEAVREDLGDVLSPAERAAFDGGDAFEEIRSRLNVDGWRRIWGMRNIAFSRPGVPRAGPVSALNLIHKKRATLGFLHVHHDDLKHAIELAGANHHNAQETWQRVFRDAERAVLRKTTEAFPELAWLPTSMREAILWQKGIGGQQGLYPTACSQYRDSMNSVAAWAKGRSLMDYTGADCVPLRASLLDAQMNNPPRVAVLQAGDGYDEAVAADVPDSGAAPSSDHEPYTKEFEALLSDVPILQMLSPDELRSLSLVARPLLAMSEERIVIQGTAGDSLFVVADGEVEVVLRRDSVDVPVDTMGRGAVFGEMSLLTGEQRNATVRAVDTALIFEIGRQQYEPLLQGHPEWLDDLAEMMEDRLRRRGIRIAANERGLGEGSIRDRIRQRFFTPNH